MTDSAQEESFLKVKALLDGQESVFQVSIAVNDNTLGELKKKLSELSGVEESRQRLIYLGRALVSEESKLSDLGILQNHTLLMVERPKDSASSGSNSNTNGPSSSNDSSNDTAHTASSISINGVPILPTAAGSNPDPLASIPRSFPQRGFSVFMLSEPTTFVRRQYMSNNNSVPISRFTGPPPPPRATGIRNPPRQSSRETTPRNTTANTNPTSDLAGQNFATDLANNVYPSIRQLHGNRNWQTTSQAIQNSSDSNARIDDFFNPSMYDSVSSSLSEISSYIDSQTNAATSVIYQSLNSDSEVNSSASHPPSRATTPSTQSNNSDLQILGSHGRNLIDLADVLLAASQSLRTLGGNMIRSSLTSNNPGTPTDGGSNTNSDNISSASDSQPMDVINSHTSTSSANSNSDYNLQDELFNVIRVLPNISRASSNAVHFLTSSLSRLNMVNSQNQRDSQFPSSRTTPNLSNDRFSSAHESLSQLHSGRPVRISYSTREEPVSVTNENINSTPQLNSNSNSTGTINISTRPDNNFSRASNIHITLNTSIPGRIIQNISIGSSPNQGTRVTSDQTPHSSFNSNATYQSTTTESESTNLSADPPTVPSSIPAPTVISIPAPTVTSIPAPTVTSIPAPPVIPIIPIVDLGSIYFPLLEQNVGLNANNTQNEADNTNLDIPVSQNSVQNPTSETNGSSNSLRPASTQPERSTSLQLSNGGIQFSATTPAPVTTPGLSSAAGSTNNQSSGLIPEPTRSDPLGFNGIFRNLANRLDDARSMISNANTLNVNTPQIGLSPTRLFRPTPATGSIFSRNSVDSVTDTTRDQTSETTTSSRVYTSINSNSLSSEHRSSSQSVFTNNDISSERTSSRLSNTRPSSPEPSFSQQKRSKNN
ncbi:hypothetical protein AYI70_g3729 [Smittium culicis]|uniref:Ubiquitin-like domain-containing protein n=1 Tax=Smittium culicis TaxID=133412 RepID=A0A1R1XAN8_9FUNG|nr:hypothetical protein AYI70_g9551 [Smittium culicis]OMJ21023.1 hypothetical protein AYI70_g3729 [Smittium culicis]